MRVAIGVSIGTETVRAVGVHGATVRWALEATRSEGEPLVEALSALLARCPLPRWPRPHVVVAVGPAAVQVKRVAGLPPVSDPNTLTALIREGAQRFFLHAAAPLVTSGVRLVEPGVAWAAAFDAAVVGDVQRACDAVRLRLRAVVPAVVALGYGVRDEQVVWCDGAVRVSLTFAHATLRSVRRLPALPDAPAPEATPVARLTPLGDRAVVFVDAYGATQCPRQEPLALRAGWPGGGALPGRHAAAAVLALGLAISGGLVAPGLVASYAARRAEAQLAARASRDRTARDTERELGRVTSALGEIAEFQASRDEITLLLRDLTHALPDGSALLTLQLDSASGTFVALTPRAAKVVAAIERVPRVTSPEIMGPVTRETVPGGGELERVTVRVHLRRDSVALSRVPSSGAQP
jgi:hypothetical protein